MALSHIIVRIIIYNGGVCAVETRFCRMFIKIARIVTAGTSVQLS